MVDYPQNIEDLTPIVVASYDARYYEELYRGLQHGVVLLLQRAEHYGVHVKFVVFMKNSPWAEIGIPTFDTRVDVVPPVNDTWDIEIKATWQKEELPPKGLYCLFTNTPHWEPAEAIGFIPFNKEAYDENPAIALIQERVPGMQDKEQVDVWEAYHFGPAHIVIEDENLEDTSILTCMAGIHRLLATPKADGNEAWIPSTEWSIGRRIEVLGQVYQLLEDLLAIPEQDRIAGLPTFTDEYYK